MTRAVLTADEFLVHPAARERSELVRGEIRVMSPASSVHGLVAGTVHWLLASHAHAHRLGACFVDSTGFRLPIPGDDEDTVRAPDASFVRADRLPAGGLRVGDGFLRLAPDLVVEVLSPSEPASSLDEKLADYLAAGTRLIWVVGPRAPARGGALPVRPHAPARRRGHARRRRRRAGVRGAGGDAARGDRRVARAPRASGQPPRPRQEQLGGHSSP